METVGDKYMAVSGLPEACENHAKWIAKLALDMMDMAKCVQMGTEPVVSQIEIAMIRLIFVALCACFFHSLPIHLVLMQTNTHKNILSLPRFLRSFSCAFFIFVFHIVPVA